MADKYADLAKKMHDRGVELNSQLHKLTAVNADLVVKCENVLSCLKEFQGSRSLAAQISCSICLENERSHVFIPCGHGGFCKDCAERAQRRNRCFTCRGNVDSLIRVFL